MDPATLALFVQFGQQFIPIVMGLISRHKATHGIDPTPAQVIEAFTAQNKADVASNKEWLSQPHSS
jgi:hypothetical protein